MFITSAAQVTPLPSTHLCSRQPSHWLALWPSRLEPSLPTGRIRLTPAPSCTRCPSENDRGVLRSGPPFGPERRTPLCAGLLGSVPASGGEPLSPSPCLSAVATHPRRRLHPHDDSRVGSTPVCPSSALLDGMPGRIPSDHLLFPLWGLMVSRDPRA